MHSLPLVLIRPSASLDCFSNVYTYKIYLLKTGSKIGEFLTGILMTRSVDVIGES